MEAWDFPRSCLLGFFGCPPQGFREAMPNLHRGLHTSACNYVSASLSSYSMCKPPDLSVGLSARIRINASSVVLCLRTTLCYVISHCMTLWSALLCCMLCYVTLCYVVLCLSLGLRRLSPRLMLCFAISSCAICMMLCFPCSAPSCSVVFCCLMV